MPVVNDYISVFLLVFRCFFFFKKVDEDGLPVAKPQLGSIMEERERQSSMVSNSARDNDGGGALLAKFAACLLFRVGLTRSSLEVTLGVNYSQDFTLDPPPPLPYVHVPTEPPDPCRFEKHRRRGRGPGVPEGKAGIRQQPHQRARGAQLERLYLGRRREGGRGE